MEYVLFKGEHYFSFEAQGNAAQFAIPFAKHFCKGEGYDIGFCKEEWKFPGAIGIDESLGDGYHAMNLPRSGVDYIFSSHCLEHVDNWVETLEYWLKNIRSGGTLFLYLPDFSQSYWRPWHNRKHRHCLMPEILRTFLKDHGCNDVHVSNVDFNHSFMVVATMP
jgi:hypothetical protein